MCVGWWVVESLISCSKSSSAGPAGAAWQEELTMGTPGPPAETPLHLQRTKKEEKEKERVGEKRKGEQIRKRKKREI